jgi:L-lysine 6-transaminase
MVKLYHEKVAVLGGTVPRYSETPGFIYFEKGFHGRSVYTLNVTDMPHNKTATKHFHGLTPRNVMVPYPEDFSEAEINRCVGALYKALSHNGFNIAGIIVEPMQGAGGHRTAPAEFFKMVSQLAHDFNVSLCFDEVQTAGGLTGTTFLIDQYDLPFAPDVVVAAKKFACGVVWMKRGLIEKGILDSTWSGTLADMVRFVQEWKIVEEEELIQQVAAKADNLAHGLLGIEERYPDRIKVVNGAGLYLGFTLLPPLKLGKFLANALDKNLLLFGAGTDSIRLRPNLSVTHADINTLLALLDELVSEY